eukprot:3667833-Pyramimonas_sp.AAC.1
MAQQFAVLKSQEYCSGTTQGCQSTKVNLVRDVPVPKMVLWRGSRVSSGCLPAGHFPQWK